MKGGSAGLGGYCFSDSAGLVGYRFTEPLTQAKTYAHVGFA